MAHRTCPVLVGTIVLLVCGGAPASAEPLPGPMTIWKFLGIPQNFQKNRDARVNRNGNNPDRERKPPLKRLADPENLKSENPAIKAAAEIKTEEDLAPQKVKAIKYLATIGCRCYPQVKQALLAALDDCTEEVRYQAAVAFCRSAGNPCTVCNSSSCCDPDVRKKLKDMAYGMDANNCWKEPSARVRAAAELALNACEAVAPPSPTPVEAPKEVPTERGITPPVPPVKSQTRSDWIEVGDGEIAFSTPPRTSGPAVSQAAFSQPEAIDTQGGETANPSVPFRVVPERLPRRWH